MWFIGRKPGIQSDFCILQFGFDLVLGLAGKDVASDESRFLWLTKPVDCPKKAVGFDFDGAQFTHVGNKVSFEVLLTSFGLERDIGLARLGALVHQLDVGGIPVAEAAGFVAILTGARELQPDDDALLNAMSTVPSPISTHSRVW